MKIETAWYEFSPYIFVGGGIAAMLYSPGSILLKLSGLLLFFVAITIFGLRWIYRHRLAPNGSDLLDQQRFDKLVAQDLFYNIDTSIH